jgi:hypothetical protein
MSVNKRTKNNHPAVPGDCVWGDLLACLFRLFWWNNGLREAVVTNLFLFLSTFFIQVLLSSYK